MKSLDVYQDQQTEILSMISDLKQMMNRDNLSIRPNAKTAHQMLCDLSDAVKSHLADEDKGLYPSLLIHEDPQIKKLAWGFISGEKPLRHSFDDYFKRWLKDCDFKFTDEFLADTSEIFEMIEERVEREQQVLFPRLVEIGMFEQAKIG